MTDRLRLLLGGDVMLGRLVTRVLERDGAGYPFAALRPFLQQADLRLVNLECAISASRGLFHGAPKAFYFRGDPDAVEVLARAGIDCVSLANNHVLDAGVAGLADTLRSLDANAIAHAGAGMDLAAATAVAMIEARGQRVGLLAACDHQADFAAGAARPGIHYLDLQRAAERARLLQEVRAAARDCDHLVVSLHWLPNWVPWVPQSYRRLAGELLAAGARIVWGHSPHHILGSEWGRAGAGVILYSTGDLIDDYAIDARYRNDHQLLYLLELVPGGVARLAGYPLELQVGRALPASAEARRWIRGRLVRACAELGSTVVDGDAHMLEIRRPDSDGGGRHAPGR